MRRKTMEEFKTEVYDAVGEEYTVLGDYINTNEPILMRHEKCKHEWSSRPDSFIHGSRCPKCFGKIKKTTEDFKIEVYNSVGNEYTVLGEYDGTNEPILMRHEKCGYEYAVSRTNFIYGRRCPKCFGTHKKTTEDFKIEVYDSVGNEYTVLGEYNGTNEPILMRHEKCGYEYFIRPKDFNRGRRCFKCESKKRIETRKISKEEFVQRMYDAEGNNYVLVGKYIDYNTPVAIKHVTCGNLISGKTTPKAFLNKNVRCKECNKGISQGVRKINKYLRKRNINFTVEKTYDNLRDIYALRYDFYLETNENVHCLIEFDGTQHFTPTIWEKIKDFITQNEEAIERLLLQHEHDMMKEEYAKKNKIPLLRIRYDQVDKIEEMIDDLLAHPKKYIYRHNTYLTQEEYWAPFEKSMKKIRPKYSTACA